jgi:hypothetical protein
MSFLTKNLLFFLYEEVTWIVLSTKDFCEKAHERLFLALFAVHTGTKKDFVKKCENL